ncbi:GAF domain-containing protein [Phytophthora infestans]|uniref:GAF domain-containing protein n=1 Tax=Phytophthora infestans TaxID=4787 RepID=A0A833SJG1_PHYIN|nr:GAF domain-containing protein [Phytophthora infestans]
MLERVSSIDMAYGSEPHCIRFRSKVRSTAASSLLSSIPPFSSSSNGSAPKPRVHVDDDELCARAEAVARTMDFRGLAVSNALNCRWILNKSHGAFTTYARRPAAMAGPEEKTRSTQQVLAAGEICCDLQEVVNVLNTTTDFDHNSVMSGLYRKDFIYGSVVHVVPSGFIGNNPNLVELLQEEASMTTQVAVKTGTFVHSKLFSRDEQWCYLERAQHVGAKPDPVGSSEHGKPNSFTLTLSSLDEKELEAGKVNAHSRVKMLHDMDAGYLVEQLPGSRYARVIFFGQIDGGLDKPGQAKTSQMRARLVRLADGATRLPEIVRRRRFGAQVMADHAAFSAKNSHCICCTKSLHLLTRKHRCSLCGHFVCDRCWSVQEMENQDTRRITPLRMCSRCMEFVENGDYSAVKPSSSGKIEVKRDPIDHAPTNKTLVRLLQQELRSSSGARKNSVRTVIQYLVEQETEEPERQATEVRSIRLSSNSADSEYLAALDGGLSVPRVPLYKCSLANAAKRNYPITMPKTAANGSVPDAPIPLNEKDRLAAIARSRIMGLEDASELDMLCNLAASQLDCTISIVTAVTAGQMTVLGSNKEDLRRVTLPREHSFCQHTVMTSTPLLVPHPEADVRFQNINGRTAFDVRCYCGFPIVDEDNTVIGSLCCMDQKTHEMTQSQYSAMKKLADAAGLVVRSKGIA